MKKSAFALGAAAVAMGAATALAQQASPISTEQAQKIQAQMGQAPTEQRPTAEAPSEQAPSQQAQTPPLVVPYQMPSTVVTATGRPEEVAKIAGTIQVITQDRIAHSSARSVADLLAENSIGFMSEWTAAQTSINIRGASTEGQGRDFRSQILILINGHRAGTANVSKLSPADVERIEVVRGPSSVIYGSQNMGGVINIIMKTGRTAPGTLVEATVGSWLMFQGKAQTGGTSGRYDWYAGVEAGSRGDYDRGGQVTEQNTHWTRYGGTGALGIQIDEDHRIDMMVRSDGVYNAGFRGSAANVYAFDNRYNQSAEITYNGKTPDNRGSIFFQAYYVRDVDDLTNPSPLSALNAFAARSWNDTNRRQQDIIGTRFQPGYKPFEGNEILVGMNWERSTLRSNRFRMTNGANAQVSPQDNNQTDNVFAFYVEDAQNFFNDRLTVRGGIRQTWGTTAIDWTPFAPTLLSSANNYQATTYSIGGTFAATSWLNLRVGASSGFRAPTATELGANFTVTPIGTTIFGNPSVLPERANQLEAGATANWDAGRFDLAVFQNVIKNRIQATTISSTGGVIIQQYQNNPGDIVVQGVEFQTDFSVISSFGLNVAPSWNWNVFGNGYYNFKMIDYGAAPAFGTDTATRINQYQMSIGTRFGQGTVEMPWNLQVLGLLRGPMWYNTEESLNPNLFPGQIRSSTVYRKPPFWVWNMRGELEVRKGVKLFAAINNIFDINDHPIFIGLDSQPCGANLVNQNGACGNSMPGREFLVGAQVRF